ncbi:MAG: PxKF domain-containing protein [Actinobacteria bacterium]|nr:PxKF domain-containing protein [Actinomycetota bacterium]
MGKRGTALRRSVAMLATVVMALGAVVATGVPAAVADHTPPPAGGPYRDQFIGMHLAENNPLHDPECTATDFPGTRSLLGAEQRQSFVPSRGALSHVQLCLTANFDGTFTVVFYEPDGSGGLVEQGRTEGSTTAGTRFVTVGLPAAVAANAGQEYVLEVLGPIADSPFILAWRMTCSPGLLSNECPAGSPDLYAAGVAADGAFGENADFGFRTLTPSTADLTGSIEAAPRHICPDRTFSADVTITNAITDSGGSEIRPSHFTVTLVAGPATEPLARIALGHLGPGQQVRQQVDLAIPAAALDGHDGRAQLQLTVDADDVVVEEDETNNTASVETVLTSCDPVEIASVGLTADRNEVPAGVGSIPIESLPIAELSFSGGDLAASPYNDNPYNDNPYNDNPYNDNPYNDNPYNDNPYTDRNPLLAGTLNTSPVDASRTYHDDPANASSFLFGAPISVLATTPLTSVGMVRPGGWQAVIDDHTEAAFSDPAASPSLSGVAIQDLTLLDIMRLAPPPSPPITHLDIDVDASPLGVVTGGAAALGSTPLANLRLPGDEAWCTLLATNGVSCAEHGLDPNTSTLVTVNLLGLDMTAIPWDALTFDRIELAPASPLGAVSMQIAAPFPGFDPRLTPWASTPVAGELAALVSCTACGTLGQVAEADAFVAGTTFADLLAALPAAERARATVHDALRGTTHDLDALPFENADLGSLLLSSYAQDGPFVTYSLTTTPSTTGSSLVDPQLAVTLPRGFAFVPGSAALVTADGAARLTEPVDPPRVGGTRQLLTFTTDLYVAAGDSVTLTLQANPGHVLETGTAAAEVAGTDALGNAYTANTAESAPVTVTERFEPNAPDGDPSTWTTLTPDALSFSHIAQPHELDTWLIPVPAAGSELRIVLSHLPGDYDLVLSGASETALEHNPYNDNPYNHNPYNHNPYNDNPYNDNDVIPESTSSDDLTDPETLQDVPTDSAPFEQQGIRAVSTGRGDGSESIHITATSGESGFYTLQVSGYNGASSPLPYVLRYHVRSAKIIGLGECQIPPFVTSTGHEGSLPAVADLDPATNTLFLVNRQRLTDHWGIVDRDAILSAATSVAGRHDLGVRGAIVPVEGDPEVAAAYTAWDANRCDPLAANAVAGTIRDVVLDYASQLPIEHVVVIGDDDQIPYTRIRDGAGLGNERAFLSSIVADVGIADVDGDPSNGWQPANGTPLTVALQAGMFLSDDPIVSPQAKPWLDQAAWVPAMGLGRLPGDPVSTVAALGQFEGSEGQVDPDVLTPTHAVTTGYQHLLDGGTQTADDLDAALGIVGDRLLSDTWTADDLRTALDVPAGAEDVVASLNGHSDHRRFLAAHGSVTHDYTDTFFTDDLAALPPGSIVTSMGCHFGYDLPTQAGNVRDWADAVAARRGIVIANSGFNYGDTDTIAAGELYSVLLARNLDGSMTVGQARAFTSAQVYAREGGHAAEAYKAMQGMLLFGLPMYRIAGTETTSGDGDGTDPGQALTANPIAPPATTTPVADDPATGLGTAELTLDLRLVDAPGDCAAGEDCLLLVNGDNGVHFEVIGPHGYAPIAVTGRPTGARAILDVTGIDPAGRRVHGAVLTALESQDLSNDPAFARAILSSADIEPEPEALGTIYPTRPLTITTIDSAFGEHQVLTVLPWTFRSTGVENGEIVGDLRLDTHLRIRLLLSDATTNQPSTIQQVVVDRDGGDAVVTATVDTGSASTVAFSALLRDQFGDWHHVDLSANDGGTTWTGRSPLPGADTRPIEVLGQAVNARGDVSFWRNKGDLVPLTEPGELAFNLAGTPGANGWFISAVTVELPPLDGAVYERRDAGSDTWVPIEGTSFVVDGDGVHVLDIRSSEGALADDVTIPIDATGPSVSIESPADGATYAHDARIEVAFTCSSFGPSGEGSCTGDHPIGAVLDLPPGTHTFTVTATDGAGNVTTTSATFTVLPPPYEFDGFYSPIVNDVWNDTTAGSAEPMKWRVYLEGVLQEDTGIVVRTDWQQVTCTTAVADASSLGSPQPAASKNNQDVYITGRRMQFDAIVPSVDAGTCWRFELGLDDGSTRYAWFRLPA